MAWIYLLIASLFEIAWTFCVKFLEFKKILAIKWLHFFDSTRYNLLLLAPFAGYIVFGLANIYFFSTAIKTIPTPTAMAVWFAVALIGVKLVDMFVFKQPYNFYQFLYFALVIIGVVGLQRDNAA